MAKKVIKKQKLKISSVLIVIAIIVFLFFLIKWILSFKIQNIFVIGTDKLNDEYIISEAGLNDYPSYFKNFSFSIENRLKYNPYIKEVNVDKSFFGVVNINIVESEVLFFREYDKKYVLDNGEVLDSLLYDYSPVRIINYVPDLIYEQFYKKFSLLDVDVRNKISQIKYNPSDYDDGRFLIYMCDGNYVYVTISKFDSLNYYNDIYPTLEGKKGILYLDSGNHFQEIK